MMTVTTDAEHRDRLGRQLAVFYCEHGDYRYWTDDEKLAHDRLVARVCEEDGVPPPQD